MRAAALARAMRRTARRAPWSAAAVTEQLLTTTTSAASTGAGLAPAARRPRSTANESAWLTRQPNVTTVNFIVGGI